IGVAIRASFVAGSFIIAFSTFSGTIAFWAVQNTGKRVCCGFIWLWVWFFNFFFGLFFYWCFYLFLFRLLFFDYWGIFVVLGNHFFLYFGFRLRYRRRCCLLWRGLYFFSWLNVSTASFGCTEIYCYALLQRRIQILHSHIKQ